MTPAHHTVYTATVEGDQGLNPKGFKGPVIVSRSVDTDNNADGMNTDRMTG
jgi:hypothetical protein